METDGITLDGDVAAFGLEPGQGVGGGAETAVVRVEPSGRVLVGRGGRRQLARGLGRGRRRGGHGTGGLVGALAGVVEGGRGDTRAGRTQAPGPGREAVAGPGDDGQLGMGQRRAEGRLPSTVDQHVPSEEDVQGPIDRRHPPPHVGAHRLRARGRGLGAVVAEQPTGHDGARHIAHVEGGEHTAAGGCVLDHEGGQGLADGGGHGLLPAGVDVDEVGQHADSGGRQRGSGAAVEGESEGVDARLPGSMLGLGVTPGRLCLSGCGLGRQPAGLGLVGRPDQPALGLLGPGQLVLQTLGGGREALAPLVQGLQPGFETAQLVLPGGHARPEGGELAPHLGGLPVGTRDALAQTPFELRSLGAELGFGRGQATRLGRQLARLRFGRRQLARHPGRFGLEGGDEGVVDEGRAVALERTPALGDQRPQPPRPLAQGLGPPDQLAQSRQVGGPECRFGTEDVGVEGGQIGAQLRLLCCQHASR